MNKISMGEVVQHLSWVKALINATYKARDNLFRKILDGITRYNSRTGTPTKDGQKLVQDLLSEEFECIGFTPNLQYIRLEGSANDEHALFVHPWATPPLVFKHRRLPVILITGPGIRLNDTIVREVQTNDFRVGVQGFTG
jgi:hypothetical protein